MKNEDRWKYYSDLIIKALNSVDSRFYKINISTSYYESQAVEKLVRERYFCYELYHQMRCLDEKINKFTSIKISPEIDKRGYKLIRSNKVPDFIIHEEGTMNNNILVVEVKGVLKPSGIAKDIHTISIFLNNCKYEKGMFILYNYSLNELKNKIKTIVKSKKYLSIENKRCFKKIMVICKKDNMSDIESIYLNELISNE